MPLRDESSFPEGNGQFQQSRDLLGRWVCQFLQRCELLLFAMALTSLVSAFRTVNAATVDEKSQFFKPVLLFPGKKDKPTTAVSAAAEDVEVFPSGKDGVILLRFVGGDSRCWKDPCRLKLIDPELRGLRKFLARQRWRLAISRMHDQFIDFRKQLSCSFHVELLLPA